MPDLENTIESIARRFARDIVSQLRRTRVGELVVVTGGKDRPQPAPPAQTSPRAKEAKGKGKSKGDRVQAALAEITDEKKLTAREALILSMAVRGDAREAIPRTLGISTNTFKTQVRVLLRKIGEPNLADAAISVLRRALAKT